MEYCFYALFFLVPLVFYPKNYELFEFNKMMAVHFLAIIITGFWILKAINNRKFEIAKTPLDIPITLLSFSYLLSTFFSIDPHTSIFGYYSRFNQGLLSTISYLLLFYAFVTNFPKEKINYLFISILSSSFLVGTYGVLQHFGIDQDYWVQDVEARVFSTLGQPNWLAAYLAMIIPIPLSLLIVQKNKLLITGYFSLVNVLYLALTFTYSRGATLGLAAGLGIFYLFLILLRNSLKLNVKLPLFFLIIVATINIIWGSAFFDLKTTLLKERQKQETTVGKNGGSSEIGGGSESGQIRLIVWKGALNIFNRYPIFGSGVETFAYSYYQFRPSEHNKTSEWEFLYNKAHNEYLNYLATMGLFGFGTYLFLIISFLRYCFSQITKGGNKIILLALLAGYVSYLVQNFFGFGVVAISLLFYLFPAIAFKINSDFKITEIRFPKFLNYLTRPLFSASVVLISLLLVFTGRIWLADIKFEEALDLQKNGLYQESYFKFKEATKLNPLEPFYKSELALSAVILAKDSQIKEQESLVSQAISLTSEVLKQSPKNINWWRTASNVYWELYDVDPLFLQKSLKAAKEAVKLAPNDPKVRYNLGVILVQDGSLKEAIETLEETIKLKPERDFRFLLAKTYFMDGNKEKAIEHIKTLLEANPDDEKARENLKEWSK